MFRNKRIKICFGSWGQKAQSMVGQPHVPKQKITVKRQNGEGEPFTALWTGSEYQQGPRARFT